MTSSVLAAFFAFCTWSAGAMHSPRPDTLTVRLNVEFDRSIGSNFVKTIAKNEATAIWSAYGVELVWSDSDADAAMDLDVIVTRQTRSEPAFGLARPVLGRATIDRSGVVRGPIRVWFDAIESLLQRRDGSNPALHDREFARALGRVLAHELGHVLLGAAHDLDGLMRASFFPDDLARLDRRRFQLTDDSAGRLRECIARFSDALAPESCSQRLGSD